MWELLGLRLVRAALPTFAALLLLALLAYEPSRLWLMDLVQDRAERRVERMVDTLLTPRPLQPGRRQPLPHSLGTQSVRHPRWPVTRRMLRPPQARSVATSATRDRTGVLGHCQHAGG
jgi:hypothetical protein